MTLLWKDIYEDPMSQQPNQLKTDNEVEKL